MSTSGTIVGILGEAQHCPSCGGWHPLGTPCHGRGVPVTITERRPHRCPVCNGRGNLPHGFYNPNPTGLSDNTAEVQCRACGGTGIVWGY
jgi:DnaJ-class molecular chaperone